MIFSKYKMGKKVAGCIHILFSCSFQTMNSRYKNRKHLFEMGILIIFISTKTVF